MSKHNDFVAECDKCHEIIEFDCKTSSIFMITMNGKNYIIGHKGG